MTCKSWLSETRQGLGLYVVCKLPTGHQSPHQSTFIPLGTTNPREIFWYTDHDKANR